MSKIQPLLFMSLLFLNCGPGLPGNYIEPKNSINDQSENSFETVGTIPCPQGFNRVNVVAGSFGEWLRKLRLKKDKKVYLYNGSLKQNQSAQFAVLDIPVGKEDLQQCADAVMRLKAEFLFSQKSYNDIQFKATDGSNLSFKKWEQGTRYKLVGNKLTEYNSTTAYTNKRAELEGFLKVVFSYCGTLSLAAQLNPVPDFDDIQPGDVFVKGGSPGHAMIVIDAAMNDAGKKVFMLAQSYMPAQDIHVVKNPANKSLSPWYEVNGDEAVVTPEWKFYTTQLKRW